MTVCIAIYALVNVATGAAVTLKVGIALTGETVANAIYTVRVGLAHGAAIGTFVDVAASEAVAGVVFIASTSEGTLSVGTGGVAVAVMRLAVRVALINISAALAVTRVAVVAVARETPRNIVCTLGVGIAIMGGFLTLVDIVAEKAVAGEAAVTGAGEVAVSVCTRSVLAAIMSGVLSVAFVDVITDATVIDIAVVAIAVVAIVGIATLRVNLTGGAAITALVNVCTRLAITFVVGVTSTVKVTVGVGTGRVGITVMGGVRAVALVDVAAACAVALVAAVAFAGETANRVRTLGVDVAVV